jgi:hypothetical protein
MKSLRGRHRRSSLRPCFKLEELGVRCEWIVEEFKA